MKDNNITIKSATNTTDVKSNTLNKLKPVGFKKQLMNKKEVVQVCTASFMY